MFTGLIETVGTVTDISRRGNYVVMSIASDIDSGDLRMGESVACDGACLTLVGKTKNSFTVEASL